MFLVIVNNMCGVSFMIVEYILLALSVIALVLMEISPHLVFESPKNQGVGYTAGRTQSKFRVYGTKQYFIMRVVFVLLVTSLGVFGAVETELGQYAFTVCAFGLFMTAEILMAVHELKNASKTLLKKLGFVAKTLSLVFFVLAFGSIISNDIVSLATTLLGFIVGAIVNKLANKRPFRLRPYITSAYSLTFSVLALCIIAVLYSVSEFTVLELVGFSVLTVGGMIYILNLKTEWSYYASSVMHSVGYVLVALGFGFTFN